MVLLVFEMAVSNAIAVLRTLSHAASDPVSVVLSAVMVIDNVASVVA